MDSKANLSTSILRSKSTLRPAFPTSRLLQPSNDYFLTPSFSQLNNSRKNNNQPSLTNSSRYNPQIKQLINTCCDYETSEVITNLHDTYILTEDFNHEAMNNTAEILKTLAHEGNPSNIKKLFNYHMAEQRQRKVNNVQVMEDFKKIRCDPRVIAYMEKERIKKMNRAIRQRNKKQIDESMLQR